MNNHTELKTVLRFIRKILATFINKADRETLRLIAGELGQIRREVALKLK